MNKTETKSNEKKTTRGGSRKGAGRKPKYGSPMKPYTVRLPEEWRNDLAQEFGSFQKGIESLVLTHRGFLKTLKAFSSEE